MAFVDFTAELTITKFGWIFNKKQEFVVDAYFENTVESAQVEWQTLIDDIVTRTGVEIDWSYEIVPLESKPEDFDIFFKHGCDVIEQMKQFAGYYKSNDNNGGGGFGLKDIPKPVRAAAGFAAGYKAGGIFT